MSATMTREEREAFLSDPRIGILGITRSDRAPLMAPVWYGYAPGQDVYFITGSGMSKTQAVQEAGRFSLCVQLEEYPYGYVTVEGPVTAMEPADLERDIRPLAWRYLGVEAGDRYVADSGGIVEGWSDVVVRMRPRYWSAQDFRKVI